MAIPSQPIFDPALAAHEGCREMEIHTRRLILRHPRESDRNEYVRLLDVSHQLLMPWVPLREPPLTADEDFSRILTQSEAGMRSGTEYRFFGFLSDGRLGALVNAFQIVRGAAQGATASWSVNAELAGQGLCTEAVGGMLDFVFSPPPDGLGLHRIQANIIPYNAASLRVAEKNGFRREGLARSMLQIAGQWQDHAMYAKLAVEHRFTNVVKTGI